MPGSEIFFDNSTLITHSEKQMEDIGQEFASGLKAGDCLALYGPLGSGKTVFARGVCRGLGCKIEAHSPTFNIINFYPGDIEVAHVDLFRIENGLQELGWDELIDSDRVIMVEWAEKAKKDLPSKRFDIFFKIIDTKTREVKLEKLNGSGD
jgi:tRNA threonylcarbamoyladenosine biosynthesis protein TsaE